MKKNVLIIEDNPTKQQELERVVKGNFDASVYNASSISHAYATLDLLDWDLVLLDMTFQASLGSGRETAKEALAGIEVLQYMQRMQKALPVVVATQHSSFVSGEFSGIDSLEKLDKNLKKAFPRIYRGTVKVNLVNEEWKEELCETIEKIWSQRKSPKRSYRGGQSG